MARYVSLALLAAMVVFLGITFFQVISPFVMPLFLAGVTAMLCQPLFRKLLGWTKNRTGLAAGLTTLTLLGSVLLPLALGTYLATVQLLGFARDTLGSQQWQETVESVWSKLDIDSAIRIVGPWLKPELADVNLTDDERAVLVNDVKHDAELKVRATILELTKKTFSAAASGLSALGEAMSLAIAVVMYLIALYFFLADGPSLVASSEALIPLHREYTRQMLTQFNQVVRAVVLATFAAALAQGVALGLALHFVGFGHFFLLSFLATLAALIPLGTMLMWGPCAVWLACTGHWGGAIFLVVYGAGFVGTLDNVIRTYVLQSNVTLHPLLAFVSVLGGLQLMGFWGVFIGPVVAALLHGLIKIFNAELVALSQERLATQSTGTAPTISPPSDIAPLLSPDVPTTTVQNDVTPAASATNPPATVR
ncbi:MAG: AI-2E family transporter [Planctomycetales bacterium]|nr:AI-2E family transporter [Planctomycetales bacterium]